MVQLAKEEEVSVLMGLIQRGECKKCKRTGPHRVESEICMDCEKCVMCDGTGEAPELVNALIRAFLVPEIADLSTICVCCKGKGYVDTI